MASSGVIIHCAPTAAACLTASTITCVLRSILPGTIARWRSAIFPGFISSLLRESPRLLLSYRSTPCPTHRWFPPRAVTWNVKAPLRTIRLVVPTRQGHPRQTGHRMFVYKDVAPVHCPQYLWLDDIFGTTKTKHSPLIQQKDSITILTR